MIRSLWRTAFLAIVTAIFLVGSGASTSVEGESNIQPSSPVELTEFYYLPLVTRFPPVWFVKTPTSPAYFRNFANNAGCNWLGIAGEVWDLH
ncbi:MAG: hypothetical protein PVH03_03820 [Chloroflexota bacterium]|jgi:hypothetical protein